MFEIGDKVVPTKKSIVGTLRGSTVWNCAKEAKVPYLYVVARTTVRERYKIHGVNLPEDDRVLYVLNTKQEEFVGDYFIEGDFILYEEDTIKLSPDQFYKEIGIRE